MMANVALSRIVIRRLLLIVPLWLGSLSVDAFTYPRGGDDGRSFPPERPSDGRQSDWENDASPLREYDASDSDYLPEEAAYGSSQMNEGRDEDMDILQGFDDDDDDSNFSFRDNFQAPVGNMAANDKETMYEAYNQLHTLAQEYAKPFDAPAVVVVGHQSSGKSALIEALMGFQFNQVGGGTKTRRPVALRMQYNPKYSTPRWYLVGDDGVERPMSLKEIQDYIERENKRLERDPMRSFDPREINLRMEYKHCPNMILIDTPGLISAPKIPKGRTGSTTAMAQQKALHASAKEAERLVIEKMRCEDYIILCVEDTSDWKHGTTREVVQKADPDLSRTVIVNTKFDTKLPQFGTPVDAEEFLRAKILDRISPHRLGGPFYTSVPSGRVGRAHQNGLADSSNYMYHTDEAFVQTLREAEANDRRSVVDRLTRIKYSNEVTNAAVTSKIGLGRLRTFLEQRVDECYRRNINKIIPMLQSEYNAAERRLEACEKELEALSIDRLKAGAEAFCDDFCANLQKAMQGSITAPSSVFGETLSQESSAAGSFHNVKNYPMAVSDRTWERLVDAEVGNRDNRLYGGAQYHRALREFSLASKCLRTPMITEDEIANAAGIGATHDGVNFLHASCVIALEKARKTFEPLLGTLVVRMTHTMQRLCPVTEYMLREDRDSGKLSNFRKRSTDQDGALDQAEQAMDISQNPRFRELIRTIYENFVQECADAVIMQCRDDVIAITKYVTWNLDQNGVGAITRSLPDQTNLFSVYQVAVKQKSIEGKDKNDKNKKKGKKGKHADDGALTPMDSSGQGGAVSARDKNHATDRDYHNLVQIMEEAAMTRSSNRTNVVIGGLVQHIVFHWREQFCRAVITKFNCYFMLPFVESFHRYLRTELQKLYSGDGTGLSDVFDITAARRALELHRDELHGECMANKQLQDKFQVCARMMRRQQEDTMSGGGRASPKKRQSTNSAFDA